MWDQVDSDNSLHPSHIQGDSAVTGENEETDCQQIHVYHYRAERDQEDKEATRNGKWVLLKHRKLSG
jgi:hypothetical protein